MPSLILSDNGVSSGSAGLKTTAASDGSLALQTTTGAGTATTAVTIDTSQNVGVGVTPSAWSAGEHAFQMAAGGLTLGVVAQDVQAVAPELVTESNWGTKEEPKMRLSIYQTDLQYALMKCIQEQQAIIQSLTARITALEGA